METLSQTTRMDGAQRALLRSLIGSRFVGFEKSEIWEGTLTLPLLVFDRGNYELDNAAVVDGEVNSRRGLYPKPFLVMYGTERTKLGGNYHSLGEGGLKEYVECDFIEVGRVVSDVHIIHRKSYVHDETHHHADFTEDFEWGIRLLLDDGTSVVFFANDVDGDYIEYRLDFDGYLESVKESITYWREGEARLSIEDLDGNTLLVIVDTMGRH